MIITASFRVVWLGGQQGHPGQFLVLHHALDFLRSYKKITSIVPQSVDIPAVACLQYAHDVHSTAKHRNFKPEISQPCVGHIEFGLTGDPGWGKACVGAAFQPVRRSQA
jgi:hypothetical protein